MRRTVLLLLLVVATTFQQTAQETSNYQVAAEQGDAEQRDDEGYIIKIDDDKIYIKVSNVKTGDILSVMSNSDCMIDPKTKKQMWREPETVGQIEVVSVTSNYIVGKEYGDSIPKLAEEMVVRKTISLPITTTLPINSNKKSTIMIAPVELNFSQGENTKNGNIGNYVSDVLMQHLLKSDKIQLVDRAILVAQQNEINKERLNEPNKEQSIENNRVAYQGTRSATTNRTQSLYRNGKERSREVNKEQSNEIDYNTVLQYGKKAGVRYIVKITLQELDVSNVISTSSLNDLGSAIFSKNSRSQQYQGYMPDKVQITIVKVLANITAIIVDLQTNIILFTCSEKVSEQGKSQINLDSRNPGNVSLNSKNENFEQTITRKAINEAVKKIGENLNEYFSEKL